MLGKTNAAAASSGEDGNLVYAVNKTGIENLAGGEKVLIDREVSVLGANEPELSSYYNQSAIFGDNYFLKNSTIYKINEDLSIASTEVGNVDICKVARKIIYSYKHFFIIPLQVTNETIVFYDSANNTVESFTPDHFPFVYQGLPYIGSYVTSSKNVLLHKYENHEFIKVCQINLSNATGGGYPFFYWNNILYIIYTRDYNYPTLAAYKINEESGESTLLYTGTAPFNTSNQYFDYYPVSERSFIKVENNQSILFCAQEDGTFSQSFIDSLGYASQLGNFNPTNKTFTIIDEEYTVHVLQYDGKDSLNEIVTVGIADIIQNIQNKYPRYASLFEFTQLSDKNAYLLVGYNTSNTSGSYKMTIICLKNELGKWKAVCNKCSYYGSSSLTGFTSGNVNEQGEIEVKTILPPIVNLDLVVPAANAEIAIEGGAAL